MKEKLITFDTAKLAKEKGFNLKTPKYYTTENPHSYHKDLEGVCILGLMHNNTLYQPQEEIDEKTGIPMYRLNPAIVYAPTQSLLQKWLREKHSIAILVNFNDNTTFEFHYFIHTNISISYSNRICCLPTRYKTYEEALENGLVEALKQIEN